MTKVACVTYRTPVTSLPCPRVRRRPAAAAVLALAVAVTTLAASPPTATAAAPTGAASVASPVSPVSAAAGKRADRRRITYTEFDGGRQFRSGRMEGTRVGKGRLKFKRSTGKRRYGGQRYDKVAWTSPWVRPRHSFTELIASWEAHTPRDSWIEVRVRGRDGAGRRSSWDVLARWTAGDRHLRRRTAGRQADDRASVNVDTWQVSGQLRSYQLRVSMMRRSGTRARPNIDTLGAVASKLPADTMRTSKPGPARGKVLRVPRYSQMIHRGDYPKWDGGGEAWCSPTSTSMVLGYYGALPGPRAYRWVPRGHPEPWVDFAARRTFDYSYDGTGNWPFNTAYAARRVGKAFVTRLRSLREAERFIAAGIPLVISISFDRGELDGAPISASNGHLLVVSGFRRNGDVVVNDPAGRTDRAIRRTYDRGQLERAWLQASGGLTYVIHDKAHPLPKAPKTNW